MVVMTGMELPGSGVVVRVRPMLRQRRGGAVACRRVRDPDRARTGAWRRAGAIQAEAWAASKSGRPYPGTGSQAVVGLSLRTAGGSGATSSASVASAPARTPIRRRRRLRSTRFRHWPGGAADGRRVERVRRQRQVARDGRKSSKRSLMPMVLLA